MCLGLCTAGHAIADVRWYALCALTDDFGLAHREDVRARVELRRDDPDDRPLIV
jgi:hypothetical protein